ncbi:XrtA system polysaccharide chain length determinant [Marinobacter sp.]|uniref:XrtA system polysaccharide chain length determinant n=1 Tax=Marinobacter sp. TaxID=50741 RepID=UPI002B26750A|nr:XrtA system polysaccharide chain length determinant [Marinobacter sp.]
MALPLSKMPSEIIREVRERKWLVLLAFLVISFTVLSVGFVFPYKYQASVVIFVDDSNIIRPLMEGRAVTTKINDRISGARELLLTRSVIERLARDTTVYPDSSMEEAAVEQRIGRIRGNLFVRPRGDSYFSIGFSSESQLETFRVAQKLAQLFIEESNDRKRKESRGAYDFIDKQVKSYEQQLAQVEQQLKEFLSENTDGTEGEANARLAQLRNQLELARLQRQELNARVESLQQQRGGVRQTIRQGKTEDVYRQRISVLEERLDTLRLQYHDTYPDIVILREQIAELKKQRRAHLAGGQRSAGEDEGARTFNPLYQEITADITKARADVATIDIRISSLEKLIAEQNRRMERIQENKAQYSDLTRDLQVNREIYDDLLKRREKARVSMHLDVEGQGLSYRINEAAQYPNQPSGPRFSAFAAAGLLAGAFIPFGAIAGLLQIDPRVRVREQLEEEIGLPVLIDIPAVRTPFEKRRDRRVTVLIGVCAVLIVAVYGAIVAAAYVGVL